GSFMIRRVAIIAMASATAIVAVAAPSYAAGTVTGTVSSGKTGLTVRAGATSASTALGSLRNGTKVAISCQVTGPKLRGRVRTSDRWDRLANGGYVSDAYVRHGQPVPVCPPPAPPAPQVPASVAPPVAFVPPTGGVAIGQWVQPVPGKGTSGF